MTLSDSIEDIKGVGPSVATKLKQLKLFTVWDLINHLPTRYEDYSNIQNIAQIRPGVVTIKAEIKQVRGRYVRRGMHLTEAVASDDSGSVKLIWFNQPYREKAIKPGKFYYISGNFELNYQRLQIMNPGMELESEFPVNTARIIPIYKQTKGLKSHTIRKILADLVPLINRLPEILPPEIIDKSNIISYKDAYRKIHFPDNIQDVDQAKKRLGFDELFAITLASLLNKQQFMAESGVKIKFDELLAKQFVQSLPYKLTNAQRKVIWQIYKDMESTQPMNRLIEGDVSSGKTVVAVMSAIMALKAGYQVALMAPTEILANQHAQNIQKLLNDTPWTNKIGLLTSSVRPKTKKILYDKIESGEVGLIIGTHALITEKVSLNNLGLVIIDEQHRFGVDQRKKLQVKAGKMPHVLSMTATPIPRSLALTLYGELSVSILDEMPPGRTPVKTSIVSPNSLDPMYRKIIEELDAGRQVFVVCPLIEESDSLNVNSAEKVYENLSKKIFKQYKVALLHGKQKSDQKDQTMQDFVDHKVDILVSTTVIEVGVDVPNATVMVIEGAERFGLAQAHQLRGRVGRGQYPGLCFLVMSDSKAPTQRLKALETTVDGFKLAELDLEIRGPGAIYGTLQSGALDLRVANLADAKLIALVRSKAQYFIDQNLDLNNYKNLQKQVQKSRTITNLN